jgi:hypothetical protein
MPLTAGSTFGVYTIGPLLAAGGMGEVYPRWRRDGKELYYIAADDRLMAAATSDGMRFLLRKTVSPESPLTIVLNWKPAR